MRVVRFYDTEGGPVAFREPQARLGIDLRRASRLQTTLRRHRLVMVPWLIRPNIDEIVQASQWLG